MLFFSNQPDHGRFLSEPTEFMVSVFLRVGCRKLLLPLVLAILICPPVLCATEPLREPWNESKVVGFPDAPPPFEVAQIHAHLDIQKPMGITALPGTGDLLVHVHKGGYGGPGRLLRFTPAEQGDETTVAGTSSTDLTEFLVLDDIIYGIAFTRTLKRTAGCTLDAMASQIRWEDLHECCVSKSSVNHPTDAM